jgi:epsilon-lactone hydrolase
MIQAGSHETLLDDAIRLAALAATADVQVALEVTPGVSHVFQSFAALDEANAALNSAGAFLRAHYAASDPQRSQFVGRSGRDGHRLPPLG